VPAFTRRLDPSGGLTAPRLNVVAITIMLGSFALGVLALAVTNNPIPLLVFASVGVVLMQSPRIAQQWERAVVLRLGRFVGLRGPGLFWIVPFVDTVSSWIDQRTITTNFAAEQTLTSDTVPVSRCRALLNGSRRGEGGARGAGVRAGGELGGADGAARHHRPH
jgi:hypothetical protein